MLPSLFSKAYSSLQRTPWSASSGERRPAGQRRSSQVILRDRPDAGANCGPLFHTECKQSIPDLGVFPVPQHGLARTSRRNNFTSAMSETGAGRLETFTGLQNGYGVQHAKNQGFMFIASDK